MIRPRLLRRNVIQTDVSWIPTLSLRLPAQEHASHHPAGPLNVEAAGW